LAVDAAAARGSRRLQVSWTETGAGGWRSITNEMDSSPIQYVSAADGVRIAYRTLGHGAPLIQLPSFPHSHIGVEWELSEFRRGYELAATARKIVRYDGRGTGLSQRDVDDFSMEAMLADLDAVVDAIGADRVALNGVLNSSPVAVRYAALHPERVSHLVLWCPVIDCSVHRANPRLQAARQVMETDWETYTLTVAHSLVGWTEPEAARRFAGLVAAGIDQETALRFVPAMHELDASEELAEVRCPTLVMHRPELPLLPPGTVEATAARIPDAQLVLFPGASAVPYIGDWRAMVRAEAEFLGVPLAESEGSSAGKRVLRLLSMESEALTAREMDVVGLIARGLTNREIGEELSIATKTVDNHVGRVLVKLDLRSRTEIATWALRHDVGERTA
jgi:pimeloyl-ACP methyl ester carboxylesterase/DNA-binding CsgD family transcriptional regulator